MQIDTLGKVFTKIPQIFLGSFKLRYATGEVCSSRKEFKRRKMQPQKHYKTMQTFSIGAILQKRKAVLDF